MKTTITILAIAIGLAFVWAFYKQGAPPPRTAPDTPIATTHDDPSRPATAAEPSTTPLTSTPGDAAHQAAPGAPSTDAATAQLEPLEPIEGLRMRPADEAKTSTIGSVDPDGPYMLEAELTGWGAGVRRIRLSRYTQAAADDTPYTVQQALEVPTPSGQTLRVYPFAARSVTVNGQRVGLEAQRWQLVEPGVYRADLVDAADHPVLTITRRYTILNEHASTYDLRCDQLLKNHSNTPLRVVWEQYAQGDVPLGKSSYMGDRRLLIAGYHDLDYNPTRQFIYTKGAYLTRAGVINGGPFWHDNEDLPTHRELVWFAALNRYFAAAVHPVIDTPTVPTPYSDTSPTAVTPLDADFTRLGIHVIGQEPESGDDPRASAFTLTSRPLDIPAGGTAQLDLSLYAGPRKTEVFNEEPYSSLGFAKMVVYELGCALFTFQPLARGLLAFLKAIHFVVRDWAVAIIFLVLCVRLVLHPITKKAQVNMFKMSKQMQSMQPEIEKLKKKYKDDQQKFQQEQLKLWREKGVNPVNMLGCLPMFLQTPIWVALYAMLYLAIELRHQPAFYGFFQSITGGRWHFLGDLSSPDNFIRFAGDGYTLNLLFIHPTFAGINVLPLLMAVVFFFQQKLTTPPPANEQAAQQQKMMKFMVLLFPVMLYSAPSGLTLYILASTCAGILDSYVVRKHVKQQEEAGLLLNATPKKPPKPGGFMDRMQKALEAKQREAAKKQRSGGASKRRKGK